jgi:hypothetical protein
MMTKEDYPYNGKTGVCNYDETKATFKNVDMVQERYVSNERLKSIVSKQPVTVGIVVTEQFRNYKNGILRDDFLDCSDKSKNINHAVTLIGYGKADRTHVQGSWCREFWIL